MKKKYELVVMIQSDVKDDARDKLTDYLEKTVKALGGVVSKVQEMGKKQLAYKISGQSEAVYLDLMLELPPAEVVQLGRKLTVESQKKQILRHLLVIAE